ncbi:MAG: restriction endonuclease [Acidobacteria bacterium]|nr:restriction endonuclease [Acidobacteriota bacterium]
MKFAASASVVSCDGDADLRYNRGDFMNQLHYGDNLDVLRRHVGDESVDLVYLDPPFNSNANYNVLFAEHDGTKAASQIKAFEDTWEWDQGAARAYEEVVERGGRVSQALQAFRTFLGDSDMLAYLSMMALRLVELRRVLKATGSIYLHCDPTASHYLKMLMDAVFGPRHFRNEIVWERTTGRKAGRQFGRVHDVLLFFSKSDDAIWNAPVIRQDEQTARGHDLMRDEGGVFRVSDPTGAGQGPPRMFGDRLIEPPAGRHWAFNQDGVDLLMREGRIIFSRRGQPRLKTYVRDLPGVAVRDIWTDIEPLNAAAAERLDYPTQKPEALLERIIEASSREGDLVLDPFCGCGTTIIAAQKLNRRWIGIDITNLAITLIRSRLTDTFGGTVDYEVIGEPASLPDAARLAADDPYQFQWWALGLVGARPVEPKKGGDKGIDGRIYFHAGNGRTRQIVLSVKAGHAGVSHVRDLREVVERGHAEIGVLIALDEPTAAMRKEAASAGFYASPWGTHARLQLLTVEDLLTGNIIDRPPVQTSVTFKRAPKATPKVREHRRLEFGAPGPDQAF